MSPDLSQQLEELQSQLLGFVISSGVPRSLAGDVLQEANLYIVRNIAEKFQGGNFRAWVYQVVKFRIMSHYRDHSRNKEFQLEEETLDNLCVEFENQSSYTSQQTDALKQCLAKLPEKSRSLFEKCYAFGYSLQEIADSQGKSYAALAKQISRIRQKIKTCTTSLIN
ncbi:sigma-70 family RNA polymerase sigma factor [Persicirhabdus sediminis]|uniref:Sigma-70 family RNA polymerase sigma factor n=1 Tax=Persicirhabdus sediminis TaxID=454144 RepID=A0A8J7SL73_9BACT|nr:sigma-70 family RNA polymerase sigma factor [Persicirhabdus sediminis]MBK1792614.1 sigma-70 family RNA polymerase sigma factor [Persicirhabdus sediminis]